MKYLNLILAAFISLAAAFTAGAYEKTTVNADWLFSLSDNPSASRQDFDDSSWRNLDLPHDWAFQNGYSEDGAQEDRGGYAGGGVGWYRKHFTMSAADLRDSRHFVCFDAVYMNSEVWINGHYLGKRPYGYISFEYELTGFLKQGDNVIAVRADNSLEPSTRWYHGCGIYGNVHFLKTSPIRFAENSIYVTTPEITAGKAEIRFTAEADLAGKCDGSSVEVAYRILSPEGKTVASARKIALAALEKGISVTIADPEIWDTDHPSLYRLELSMSGDRRLHAAESVRFGIRTVEWKPETGFWLNGKNMKLQGVCEHLEGGPVGAAWTEDLLRWKVQLIKDMGCNSIRTAHNPQLPFFYDICDEMGVLVMDEAFDGWSTKARYDYGNQAFAQWWERDLRAFLRRDRNHPCVIIWSMGNETRGAVSKDLVRVCHEVDPTRLVTSGHSGSEDMDVLGMNGHSERKSFIETFHTTDQAFVGTETPHTWLVRGYYRTKTWYRDGFPNRKQEPYPIPDLTEEEIFTYEWASPDVWTNKKQHFNSSYDNATVRLTARHNIQFLRDIPWYSGSYRWTGFDYLGEAGYVHGGWPFRAFMGGPLDMAGFKKDLYYLYQGEWTGEPMVHILPHWTHPYMKEDTEIPVLVYTNAEKVELFFNGKSLGTRSKGTDWSEMQCEWLVPWKEGTIEAVAYTGGKEVARTSQKTSAQPSCVQACVKDITRTVQDRQTFVLTLSETDPAGTFYPYGENRIWFNFQDNINIISLENGNPVDVETNWNATSKNAFFGLLRGFLSVPAKDKHAVVVYGAVLGDKKLKINDKVSIDVRALDLVNGKDASGSYEIRYTLDGTEPSQASPLYTGSFSVAPETVVKARVYEKGECLLDMQEKFGRNEGIYWETGEKRSFSLKGIQAEMAQYEGLVKKTTLPGFQGECCLETMAGTSSLSCYQENDGAARNVPFSFSFFHKAGKVKIELFNNGEKVGQKVLKGAPSGKWETIVFDVPLTNGANQLHLVITGDAGNGVDWFELSE